MKLYNTLTRKIGEFISIEAGKVRMYSCGPTVYDHIHIGNLSAFIYADTLRRTLQAAGMEVRHVMNFTDVDDKTIKRSAERYPDMSPEEALTKLTNEYATLFMEDTNYIGNDTAAVEFVHATKSLDGMRKHITELYDDGFAYIAEDGIYFSIEKYRTSGRKYGQLLDINAKNTSSARIQNDEYDKESAHDFALWKIRKPNEPAWQFDLDGHDLTGRPGWHIECSVMSVQKLGQPFDIHTGGVDLIFPHHENEIAQSTAGKNDKYAKYFFHNEHLLVDGRKMSKSLNNFYTLQDIKEHGYDPLAFRLMVLQSHYRSQSSFTWENLEAAQNRLKSLQAMAVLQWQTSGSYKELGEDQNNVGIFASIMQDDLDTPTTLAVLSRYSKVFEENLISHEDKAVFKKFLRQIDQLLGLNLSKQADISDAQKHIFSERQKARYDKDWETSDNLRDELKGQGIGLHDTDNGSIWYRL